MRTKIEQANVQKMENETKNFCGNRIFPVSRVRLFFLTFFFATCREKDRRIQ